MVMYFIVLAKVFRPSSTPRTSTPRFCLRRIISAASRATSTAVSTDADIRLVQSRRIVDAVAQVADDMAAAPECLNDALFLVRVDLDEEIGVLHACKERTLGEFRQVLTGHYPVGSQADRLGEMRGNVTVVARNDLYRDASLGECRKRLPDAFLRRVEEEQEASEGEIGLVLPRKGAPALETADCHTQDTIAFRTPAPEFLVDRGTTQVIQGFPSVCSSNGPTGFENILHRALRDQKIFSVLGADNNRQPLCG